MPKRTFRKKRRGRGRGTLIIHPTRQHSTASRARERWQNATGQITEALRRGDGRAVIWPGREGVWADVADPRTAFAGRVMPPPHYHPGDGFAHRAPSVGDPAVSWHPTLPKYVDTSVGRALKLEGNQWVPRHGFTPFEAAVAGPSGWQPRTGQQQQLDNIREGERAGLAPAGRVVDAYTPVPLRVRKPSEAKQTKSARNRVKKTKRRAKKHANTI